MKAQVTNSLYYVLLMFIILSHTTAQGNGGLPGYQLRLNPDTRSWGMGQAGVAITDNSAPLFWNAAGLSYMDRNHLMLSHQSLWGFAQYGYLSYTRPTLSGTYAIGYSQISSGSIDEIDRHGNKIGSFSDVFRVMSLGYGAQLFKYFSLGIVAKGLNHSFINDITYGYTFNGGMLIGPFKGITIGISGSDFYGREIKEKEILQKFSMSTRIGISYRTLNDNLTLAFDFQSSQHTSQKVFLGAEYTIDKKLVLRFGREGPNNTVGLGIQLGDLSLDIAFVEHELGSRKLFSLSHTFGRSISELREELKMKKNSSEILYAEGLKNYHDQKYKEALTCFEKALSFWPDYDKAQQWKDKTTELLTKYDNAQKVLSLNKYSQARTYLMQALQIEPEFKKAQELKLEIEQKLTIRKTAESYFKSGLEFEKNDFIKDAIEMWQKTLVIDPEHPAALSKMEHYGQLEPLKCEVTEIHDVFAAMYKYYANNPFGVISIRNKDNIVLKDVVIRIMIQKYLDFPTIIRELKTIPGDTTITVPIVAVFNNHVLSLTEDTKVSAEISISYTFRRRPIEHKLNPSFTMFNRNVIKWDDTRKVASFITPKDLVVRSFANNILSLIDIERYSQIPKHILQAMALFDGMTALGIQYRPDPNNPYVENYLDRNRIDLIWYPRETLEQRSGDCDDLTVLYCSLLETVGIRTAVIDIPGHLLMAFDTGVAEEEAYLVSSNAQDYILLDGHVWILIETTQVAEGFFPAWQTATRYFN